MTVSWIPPTTIPSLAADTCGDSAPTATAFVSGKTIRDRLQVLNVFRYLADRPHFLFAVFVFYVFAVRTVMRELAIIPTTQWPDLYFGFSAETLQAAYEAWGDAGRAAYAHTDALYTYLALYGLVLGSFLVIAAKRLGWNDQVAYLAVATVAVHALEVIIQRYGSTLYPTEKLSPAMVIIASLCCQLKWILLSTSCLVIVASFLVGRNRNERRRSLHRKSLILSSAQQQQQLLYPVKPMNILAMDD